VRVIFLEGGNLSQEPRPKSFLRRRKRNAGTNVKGLGGNHRTLKRGQEEAGEIFLNLRRLLRKKRFLLGRVSLEKPRASGSGRKSSHISSIPRTVKVKKKGRVIPLWKRKKSTLKEVAEKLMP